MGSRTNLLCKLKDEASVVLVLVSLLVPTSAHGQAKADTSANQTPAGPPTPQPPAATAPSAPTAPARTEAAAQAGADRPATLVPANSGTATLKVQLRGLDRDATSIADGDLEAGLLVAPQQPGLQVRPSVRVVGPAPVANGESLVTLEISGLVAFGETSVSLSYKGRRIETLRFFKTGLLAKPAGGDSGFVVRESKPFFLVLENISTFGYQAVHARLRFGNYDLCSFTPEKAGAPATVPDEAPDCVNWNNWTPFDIRQYAQVTLVATPRKPWFVDPASDLAKSGKQSGQLALRFAGSNGEVYEQIVPLEIDFKPSEWSLFWNIAWVALPITLGALLSIFLRISLPNLKRRRQLKNQLNEVAKATAAISTATESNLRVLLRVARLELKETLKSGWWFGPNDTEYTQRVEQALPGLKKRIEGVRRLDAALLKRAALVQQGIAPTRLEQIDELVDSLKDSLKQDQLTDEDWVSLNQRLEAVQKLLRDPTQTERDAIEAMLAGRWQAIRDHFGVEADGRLKVPPTLQGLEPCFPTASLLPGTSDAEKDGVKWIKAVGTVRADLQLTALQRLWDFQFLAPAKSTDPNQVEDPKWANARATLSRLLATPATDNLLAARLLLRQLASGISTDDIVKALVAGKAMIVWDPQNPGSNQKIRYHLCFLQDDLNAAVARESVTCRWHFEDQHASKLTGTFRALRPPTNPTARVEDDSPAGASREEQAASDNSVSFNEEGWSVYHYLEPDVTNSTIDVAFYDSRGDLIELKGADWTHRTIELRPQKRKGAWAAFGLETVQLGATVLVPLATLAVTTASGAAVGHWWELIGIGFGADTLKNIIAVSSNASTPGPTG
jgi:hypothetical protein